MNVIPDGYKTVTHKPCGGVFCFVKEEVTPGMRIRAADVLTTEGGEVLPHERIPRCPVCGMLPQGWALSLQIPTDKVDIEL